MKRFLSVLVAAAACAMNVAAEAQVTDLSITNSDGVPTATPGGSVSYTITAANLGPGDALGSNVIDTFPASANCAWTCVGSGGATCTASGSGNINDSANLPNAGSVTYSATCNVSSAATGSLVNTATVAPFEDVTDSAPANNSATDTDTLSPQANLAITNTDGVAAATPGGSVTYTITASNAGPSDAPGTTVGDTFPAALTCGWSCVGSGGGTCKASGFGNINDAVSLPSGSSVTYTANCNVSAAATGSLSNTAMVIAAGGITDPAPANNSATDTDTLPAATVPANLGITISDGATTAIPGTPVVYTITASNAGPNDAPGSIVADTFPPTLTACTWTCASGNGTCSASGSGNINDVVNLPNGGSVTYTATCNIAPAATGSLANVATVTAPATVSDSVPANNSATDTDTLTPKVNLCITNTDNATINPTKIVVAGKTVRYTVKAFNTTGCSTATPASGPSSAPAAVITDTFPAPLTACTWTCSGSGGGVCSGATGSGNLNETVNLPFGGSVTYQSTCTVPASTTVGGLLNNTATVAAGTGVSETASTDNSAIDTFTVALQPDLTAAITDGVTTVKVGDTVTYTGSVTNAGPTIALHSSVVDQFPSGLTACTWTCSGTGGGTCSASGSGNINDTVDLVVGAKVTYIAQCKVTASATGTLANTITGTPPAGMTLPPIGTPHNSATDADVVNVSSDIAVTMTDNRDSVQVGDVVDYVIDVTNPSGPSSPAIAEIIDVLPAELGSGSWTCTPSGNATCNSGAGDTLVDIATIPVGGKVEYVYSAVLQSAPSGDVLSNTASASLTNGSDPATGNNSATDSDSDTVAIFTDAFDENPSVTTKLGETGAQVSAQLQVDGALLQQLGVVPVDIANGRAADGHRLFTIQIARFGSNVVLRTLTTDARGMNEIAAWQAVDLSGHLLEFTWQSASAQHSDGYFAVAGGGAPVLIDGRTISDQLSSLQITVQNDVPWLTLIGQ